MSPINDSDVTTALSKSETKQQAFDLKLRLSTSTKTKLTKICYLYLSLCVRCIQDLLLFDRIMGLHRIYLQRKALNNQLFGKELRNQFCFSNHARSLNIEFAK